MKQKIVNEAMNIIRLRREESERKAQASLERAMKNEEFKKAYSQFSAAKIERARCQAYNLKDDSNFDNLRQNLVKIIKKGDFFDIFPKYHCSKCKDSGIVDGQYCDCLKREITQILLKSSGFDKLENFESARFDMFEDKDKAQKIYSLMQKWCSSSSQKSTILLCGPAGTGKTHLSKCMADALIKRGLITQMLTAFSLNQKFLAIHTSSEEEKNSISAELTGCEALFIDDLGTEPVYRNVTREYLYNLINERQTKGLRTIITSNLYPDDIMARYDERIFSRLMDKEKSIVIEMGGKDLRLRGDN